MNIRELAFGNYVKYWLPEEKKELVVQVTEIALNTIKGVVCCDLAVRPDPDYVVGRVQRFKMDNIGGIPVRDWILRRLDFVESDRKGWQLMYYYGDMIILYRHNNANRCASFRLMSDFTKSYTRISCRYIHQLQNIMRFLVDGLEFEYQDIKTKDYGAEQ